MIKCVDAELISSNRRTNLFIEINAFNYSRRPGVSAREQLLPIEVRTGTMGDIFSQRGQKHFDLLRPSFRPRRLEKRTGDLLEYINLCSIARSRAQLTDANAVLHHSKQNTFFVWTFVFDSTAFALAKLPAGLFILFPAIVFFLLLYFPLFRLCLSRDPTTTLLCAVRLCAYHARA